MGGTVLLKLYVCVNVVFFTLEQVKFNGHITKFRQKWSDALCYLFSGLADHWGILVI